MLPPSPMPGAPPPAQAGAGTLPGQPPFGSSPVQMPTPDRGNQAAALAKVSTAVRILELALPELGATSEAGKAVLTAVNSLAKHIPPGSINPGVENSSMMQMMSQQKQEQPMISALRAMGQGGMPGGGAPASDAAPPTPPPPM